MVSCVVGVQRNSQCGGGGEQGREGGVQSGLRGCRPRQARCTRSLCCIPHPCAQDGTPKSAAANGTAPASGAAPPATSSIFGPAAAAAGPSSEATSAAAAATAADDLALQFAKLTEAVDAKMKALAERERSMAAAAVGAVAALHLTGAGKEGGTACCAGARVQHTWCAAGCRVM